MKPLSLQKEKKKKAFLIGSKISKKVKLRESL